jgi:hypothetical protein
MDRLNGNRALVTSGTSRIGLETARQFLKQGPFFLVRALLPVFANPASIAQCPRQRPHAYDRSTASWAYPKRISKALAESIRNMVPARRFGTPWI